MDQKLTKRWGKYRVKSGLEWIKIRFLRVPIQLDKNITEIDQNDGAKSRIGNKGTMDTKR